MPDGQPAGRDLERAPSGARCRRESTSTPATAPDEGCAELRGPTHWARHRRGRVGPEGRRRALARAGPTRNQQEPLNHRRGPRDIGVRSAWRSRGRSSDRRQSSREHSLRGSRGCRQTAGAGLGQTRVDGGVVVGLARGGVPVAAEVARCLSLPLDALAVSKVGHPSQPEYGIGGVTPSRDGVYVRSTDGLTEEQVHRAVDAALAKAVALDLVLHRDRPPLDVCRQGRPAGRRRVGDRSDHGRGNPLGAPSRRDSDHRRRPRRGGLEHPVPHWHEADEVVCPHALQRFGSVGYWYQDFTPVSQDEVVRLLDEVEPPRGSNGLRSRAVNARHDLRPGRAPARPRSQPRARTG